MIDDPPLSPESYLIAHYSKMTIRRMARETGWDYDRLQHLAASLRKRGILDIRDRYYQPPWSEEEEEWLADAFGSCDDRKISRRLGRTITGLKGKAWALGLRKRDNAWTKVAVGDLFGVHPNTVTSWVRRGFLFPSVTGYTYHFDHDELERFVRAHPYAYDARKMRPGEYLTNLAREVARTSPLLTKGDLVRMWGLSDAAVDWWLHEIRPIRYYRKDRDNPRGKMLMFRAEAERCLGIINARSRIKGNKPCRWRRVA